MAIKKIDWKVGRGPLGDEDRFELKIMCLESDQYLYDYLEFRFGATAIWFDWYPAALKWLRNNEGKGLVLFGKHGTGKTVFACNFFPQLLRSLKDIIIHPEIARILSRPEITRVDSGYLARYLKIIDDLGTEQKINEYGIRYEPFIKVVDDCVTYNKFLIITTTMSQQDIYDRYGHSTYKALQDMCLFIDTSPKQAEPPDEHEQPIEGA